MASGIHFHSLCIWLFISTGIILGYARTIDVPRNLCYSFENTIDLDEMECKYGSYTDICGRKKCYGGPGDDCKQHDGISRCHSALVCNCNKCMGCVGPDNCHMEICPMYSNWRKRFGRTQRGFEV